LTNLSVGRRHGHVPPFPVGAVANPSTVRRAAANSTRSAGNDRSEILAPLRPPAGVDRSPNRRSPRFTPASFFGRHRAPSRVKDGGSEPGPPSVRWGWPVLAGGRSGWTPSTSK